MPSGVYVHKKGYKRPPRSKEWNTKLGLAHKGKIISKEMREVLSKKLKGRIFTPEHRKKISLSLMGEKSYNYKTGKYCYRKLIVIDKCYYCDETDNLHVHHIDKNRDNNKLENLMVVCFKCHCKIHEHKQRKNSRNS